MATNWASGVDTDKIDHVLEEAQELNLSPEWVTRRVCERLPRREQPVVELRNLYYQRSSDWVLRGVTLTLRRGEICTLQADPLSANSLFWLIRGGLVPTGGSVRVFGNDPMHSFTEPDPTVGCVFSVAAPCLRGPLSEWMDNAQEVLRNLDLEYAWCLCRRFGLCIYTPVEDLSSEDQVAAQAVTALARHPELLLVNLSSSGLAWRKQEILRQIIWSVADDNAAVLFSTSDPRDGIRDCDQVLVLNEGGDISTEPRPEEAYRDHRIGYLGQAWSAQMSGEEAYPLYSW